MVKVTIVGRARDGFPLAQGLIYMNEDNDYLSYYRQQAEFILQEISTRALVASKMTILIDHYCGIIANITRQYIDTRTQANLSKLNASRKQDLDVVTEDMFSILERRRNSETMERLQITPQPASSIWCSPRLEVYNG
ncbi:hypothetical protein Lalb_Chr21g0305021 [Lupinus albus]|uniref:Uncharacterized protein n=1 Tax=Lupinus albus TaxID=3870 RepID=A0A6A4NR34_LUPAL|nr:hypothetical protein Lalb_Chr21g0305021 [Lupinus albus]